jgi:hypothetical protein
MAKTKSHPKKKFHKKTAGKAIEGTSEPTIEKIEEKIEEQIVPADVARRDKKHMILKGIGMHLFVYIVIALILSFLGVPSIIIFLVMMVLLWGLFMISYAFYNKR